MSTTLAAETTPPWYARRASRPGRADDTMSPALRPGARRAAPSPWRSAPCSAPCCSGCPWARRTCRSPPRCACSCRTFRCCTSTRVPVASTPTSCGRSAATGGARWHGGRHAGGGRCRLPGGIPQSAGGPLPAGRGRGSGAGRHRCHRGAARNSPSSCRWRPSPVRWARYAHLRHRRHRGPPRCHGLDRARRRGRGRPAHRHPDVPPAATRPGPAGRLRWILGQPDRGDVVGRRAHPSLRRRERHRPVWRTGDSSTSCGWARTKPTAWACARRVCASRWWRRPRWGPPPRWR